MIIQLFPADPVIGILMRRCMAAIKRLNPRDQFIKNNPNRIQISLRRDPFISNLFGRHIGWGSSTGHGRGATIGMPCDAKIFEHVGQRGWRHKLQYLAFAQGRPGLGKATRWPRFVAGPGQQKGVAQCCLILDSSGLPCRLCCGIERQPLAPGLITVGAFHAGVEYGWWEGLTRCATTFGTGGSTLDSIMNAPLIRCDVAPWQFLGISLAGWNAILSLGGALTIATLMLKDKRP